MNISKTIIEITLLHPSDSPLTGYDVKDVLYEMDEGSAVGWETSRKTAAVPADRVSAELIALGNDGTFFGED